MLPAPCLRHAFLFSTSVGCCGGVRARLCCWVAEKSRERERERCVLLMEANSFHDLKGSISLRAQETGSGFRFFFDDDEGSYFDLNLENMADSEDSEFQISFSPLPATAGALSAQQHAADELFRNGRVLPLQVTSEARSSQLVPMYVDQLQVYSAEMLPLPERTEPADEGAAGGVKPKGQLDPGSEKARGAPDSSTQCMGKKQQQQQQPQLAGTKKSSKVTAKKINNGVAKFLIKFPSETIRSTLVSVMKSYHLVSLQPKRGHGDGGLPQERAGRSKYKALLMHFSRWLATRKKSSSHVVGKSGSAAAAAPSTQRPSDVELDEDVVRSILEAVDFTVESRSRGGSADGGGSRPSQASSSSPGGIGRKGVAGAVERHSSISSAIAHCKMSYGNSTAPGFS